MKSLKNHERWYTVYRFRRHGGKTWSCVPRARNCQQKGEIPSREVDETNLKVTRPKSSKVTEKPKAERKIWLCLSPSLRLKFQVKLNTLSQGGIYNIWKFKAYAPDRRLCIYTYLQKYLAVTKSLRGDETKLLISFNTPYQAVSRDTIRRWIKQVLSNSGIDTNVFSAHSTRSASVSAANSKGVPLDKILLAGGRSHASTFSKYYNKPIVSPHGCDYGSSLLNFDWAEQCTYSVGKKPTAFMVSCH